MPSASFWTVAPDSCRIKGTRFRDPGRERDAELSAAADAIALRLDFAAVLDHGSPIQLDHWYR